MGGILEKLAYAIAKGVFTAYFEAIRKQATINIEGVSDEDRERIENIRRTLGSIDSPTPSKLHKE